MGKKKEEKAAKAKPAAADAPEGGRKKRSPLKLALLALAPLVLAGGGYFGWTMFMGEAAGEDAALASEGTEGAAGHNEEARDGMATSALPPEIKAETSFTYSFALAELLNGKCGPLRTSALKAAAEEEAAADGTLANLSWIAANRRMGTITEKSCEYMQAEIEHADGEASWQAQEKAAALAKATGEGEAHH
jgi:hypothetical protein